MYFGDFLIGRGLLTRAQLLDALAYQIEKTPTLMRLCLDSKIISEENLLQIVKYQIIEKKDFLTSIRNQNLISASQIEFLLQQQIEKRPALGRILVQKEIINMNQLSICLEEFHNSQNNKKLELTHTISGISEIPTQVGCVEKEEQAASLHKEIPQFDLLQLDETMINELLEFFDASKRQDIESLIIEWVTSMKAEILRNLYRDMHTLKGTSRFLKAHLSEYIIHNLENVVTESIRGIELLKKEPILINDLETHFLKGLDILWTIRNIIEDQQSEAAALSNSLLKQAITDIVSMSEKLQDRLIDLQTNIDIEDFASKF